MISEANIPNAAESGSSEPELTTLSPEFVNDLKEVFAKHNWPGHPIGFVARPAAAALDDAPDEEDDDSDCDPGPDSCPEGQTLEQVWVHCPDGTAILRNVCR